MSPNFRNQPRHDEQPASTRNVTERTAGNLPTGELAAEYLRGPRETEQPASPPPQTPAKNDSATSDVGGSGKGE